MSEVIAASPPDAPAVAGRHPASPLNCAHPSPISRRNVDMHAVAWHRKAPNDVFPVRGTASLFISKMAATLHGVGISVLPSGEAVIQFPQFNVCDAGGYRMVPLVTFNRPETRQRMARSAWEAVLRAFPDAAAAYVPPAQPARCAACAPARPPSAPQRRLHP